MRNISVVFFLVFLTACVTESTGGLPSPAEDNIRLKAQLDLARGYFASQDWSRARPPLRRALEIDPRSVEAHVLFAVLSEREDEPQAAEGYLKNALKIDPKFPLTHYYLGLHYLKNSPRMAKKHLVRFLKLVQNQNNAGPLVRNAEKILKSS